MANKTEETKKVTSANSSADNQKIKELENTIESLKDMIAQLAGAKVSEPVQQVVNVNNDNEITIICNTTAEVDIPFNTWRLRFTKIGQKNNISKEQFNELVNVHRYYFDCEFFLLDSKHLELASDLRLPAMDTSGKYITPKDLDRVKTMTPDDLRAYYNDLSEATKRNFVSYYLHQCNEKISGYYDVTKMETMNSLIKDHLFDNMISICVRENQNNI